MYCYSSSEDEDYQPPGSTQKNQPSRRNITPEEHAPLASRRRTLLATVDASVDAGSTAVQNGASPSTSTRSSPELPREVLHRILSFACQGKAGAVPTANIACCVSRAWRDAVQTCPSLWHTVDLSKGACNSITSSTLTTQCSRWSELRSLSLSGCVNIQDAAFQHVAASCSCIEALDLSDCKGFLAPGLADVLDAMVMRPSGPDTKPLRRLNLSRIELKPQLGIDLVLKTVLMAQADNIEGPVLEELIADGCPMLSLLSLRAVWEAGVKLKPPRALLSALRVLSLAGSSSSRGSPIIHVERFQFSCPNLEVLDIRGFASGWGINGSPGPELKEWSASAEQWPRLREFSVEGKFSSRDVFMLMGDTCVLEELRIGNCNSVGLESSTLVRVLERNPRLHTLALPYTTMLYGRHDDSFIMSVAPPASLEVLDLTGSKLILEYALKDHIKIMKNLAEWPMLKVLHVDNTVITTDGLRTFLMELKRQNRLEEFTINMDSCRGVDRYLRNAASRGMPQLYDALGIV